jgi:hypothetical protein
MTELDRLQIMTRLAERRLTRRRAAALLRLSERQVRRLYRAFIHAGAAGLASRRRGRPSARRLPAATRDRAVALIRERYADFGPTFAHQKLTEDHGLVLSVETLRGWMTAVGLWLPRARRARRSYPPRERRACLGELVQIDGSDHAWFEDRGPRCTLLVYVDDATSRLMELCFADTESTFDYFHATRRYLERHGKPMAFYSDRLSVFHVYARHNRCVAVRDRESGEWDTRHFAIDLKIAGAIKFFDNGGMTASPGLPDIGESMYFEAKGRDLVTSSIVSVERPRPELLTQYSV